MKIYLSLSHDYRLTKGRAWNIFRASLYYDSVREMFKLKVYCAMTNVRNLLNEIEKGPNWWNYLFKLFKLVDVEFVVYALNEKNRSTKR